MKSIETDKVHLRWLDKHLHDRYLDDITKANIEAIKYAKQSEGASNGTVNRMLTVLRAILNRSRREREWLDVVPNIKMLPIEN